MNKLVIGFILLYISVSAINADADPWHGYTRITHLYPSTSGMTFLVDLPLVEYSACDGGKRFSITESHPNYQTLTSALMMAFASDMEIRMNLDDRSSPTCSPTINRFFVRK